MAAMDVMSSFQPPAVLPAPLEEPRSQGGTYGDYPSLAVAHELHLPAQTFGIQNNAGTDPYRRPRVSDINSMGGRPRTVSACPMSAARPPARP